MSPTDLSTYNKYKAYVTEVYDGDTITVNIFLGFGITLSHQKIRLLDIDTPEVRGDEREEGLKTRDYVRGKILKKNITLCTKPYKNNNEKKGKYGRWLGIVVYDDINLNNELIENGLAKEVTY